METGTFLFTYYTEDCPRVKCFGGVYCGRAVGEYGEISEDETETVEQGWWNAYFIFGSEGHIVAYKETVVDDVAGN